MAGRPPLFGKAMTAAEKQKRYRSRLAGTPRPELLPREYLLMVMNDDRADPLRRDKAAIALLPYHHARMADAASKKGQRKQAAERAVETFAVPQAPPRPN